jgi:hypothetical protein
VNKIDQRALARAICRDITKAIVAKVRDMPEEWDGLELREYIADQFHRERYMSNPWRKKDYAKRLRSYKKAKGEMDTK